MLLMPPSDLLDYISFENGKWTCSEEMPKELQPLFEDFVKEYEKSRKKSFFID